MNQPPYTGLRGSVSGPGIGAPPAQAMPAPAVATSADIAALRAEIAELRTKGVKIANFNMPFWDMVGFIVKFLLASIPAWLVLAIIGGTLALLFGGALAALIGLGSAAR